MFGGKCIDEVPETPKCLEVLQNSISDAVTTTQSQSPSLSQAILTILSTCIPLHPHHLRHPTPPPASTSRKDGYPPKSRIGAGYTTLEYSAVTKAWIFASKDPIVLSVKKRAVQYFKSSPTWTITSTIQETGTTHSSQSISARIWSISHVSGLAHSLYRCN